MFRILVLCMFLTVCQSSYSQSLFSDDSVLSLSLTVDFPRLFADKVPHSKYPNGHENLKGKHPVVIGVGGAAANATVSLRGGSRFSLCPFPPLKLRFPQVAVAGLFQGVAESKIVTHCGHLTTGIGEEDQLVYEEYLIYKLYQIVTDKSFKVRLAQITYQDLSRTFQTFTRPAIFIEDMSNLARRLNVESIPDITNKKYDMPGEPHKDPWKVIRPFALPESFQMQLFQMMIFNGDFWRDHNLKYIRDTQGKFHYIPYDFDNAGSFQYPKRFRFASTSPNADGSIPLNMLTQNTGLKCLSNPQALAVIERFLKLRGSFEKAIRNFRLLSEEKKSLGLRNINEFYDELARLQSVLRLSDQEVPFCDKEAGIDSRFL